MNAPNLSRRIRSLTALVAAALMLVAAVGCGDDVVDEDADGGGSGDTTADVEPDTGVDTTDPDGGVDSGRDTGTEDSGSQFDVPQWDTGTPDTSDGGTKPLKLTSLTPTRGPVAGGTKFVLQGQGFTTDTVVYFGSKKAQANLAGGRLVGQTPKAPGPTTVSVKALDPNTGRDSISQAFTYTTQLKVGSISPTRIPTDGNVQVTIRGDGFGPKTRVSFAGRAALQHSVVNSQTLRVVAPANPEGAADVRVTTRDDSVVVRDGVEYFEPLALDRVRPATGSTSGGTSVTLHGAGFQSGMTVDFGGASGTVQSVGSDGETATATAPAHAAGLVDVSVQTPSGSGAVAADAFYYRSSSSTFELAAVRPDHAESSGNVDVTLVGSGLDRSGLSADFGGKSATVRSAGPGWATVEIPPHSVGTVDVTISDGSGNSDTLAGGFEYLAELEIGSIQPGKGPVKGGTSVTLQGKGFTGATRVEFGGAAAKFTVASDSKITATTPKHAPGRVDVRVIRPEVEETVEQGFAFEESLEVFGLNPVRGSMAGNTYVEIRGRGFINSSMGVTFGGNNAKSIRVLDPQTLAVRTPNHAPASVEVTVTRNGASATAPQKFTYFNPGRSGGGVWGGPIRGAVNVTVFSVAGRPIDGAFVMLSTNPKTDYTGQTDRNGQVTLSGPDVYGPQTITATAPGYTSSTIQSVNAENVTLFLTPTAGGGSPPPGPPTATFKGKLTGLEKIASPDANEYVLGAVFVTRESPWDQTSFRQSNTMRSNGTYEVETRLGDLALVAVGGLMNTDTNTLTPLRMGVKRYQTPSGGKTYTRDISLDIPLNQKARFKLKNPPHASGGPNVNRVTPYLNFGIEGFFGRELFAHGGRVSKLRMYAQGKRPIVTTQRLPSLTGKLSNVKVRAIGGSYTRSQITIQSTGQQLQVVGTPQSVAIKRGIQKSSGLISMPKLVGVPLIQTPAAQSTIQNNLVSWQVNSSNRPDFFLVQILTPMGLPLWYGTAPGSASSLRLPTFPSFSHLPKKKRPSPYPSKGTFTLVVQGIRHPGTSYSDLSYSDLGFGNYSSFAVDQHGGISFQ